MVWGSFVTCVCVCVCLGGLRWYQEGKGFQGVVPRWGGELGAVHVAHAPPRRAPEPLRLSEGERGPRDAPKLSYESLNSYYQYVHTIYTIYTVGPYINSCSEARAKPLRGHVASEHGWGP